MGSKTSMGLMNFYIEPSVIEKYPELKVGILILKGIENKGNAEEISELMDATFGKVKAHFEGKELTKEPKIADWREAYKAFGYNPPLTDVPLKLYCDGLLEVKNSRASILLSTYITLFL